MASPSARRPSDTRSARSRSLPMLKSDPNAMGRPYHSSEIECLRERTERGRVCWSSDYEQWAGNDR